MSQLKSLKELIDEHNALQPGAKAVHPKSPGVLVEILQAGPYSDYDHPSGHVAAKNYKVGDLARFPAEYVIRIVTAGLAKLAPEPEVLEPAERELEVITRVIKPGENATRGARGTAAELGVDLTKVTGTGANGRITVKDVRAQARQE